MSTLMLFGRCSLFLLSMTGYILYVSQKYQIHIAFAPALFSAWTSNLLFAGGILNILPQTAALIWAGGCILFVLALKRGMYFTKKDAVSYTVFLLALLYFFCLLRGAHYTSYDNFSHWATVVKDMLLQDRMPNFQDAVIRFQSYPLGSSVFLYYACRIIGTSDACLLWAQALMLLSFLFCMTAFIRKRNGYGIAAIGLYAVWALTVNNHIYELRVDTLLPLAGAAAFAVIYYYKKTPHLAVSCAAGLFMMLINIKNSGFYFYAVCALFLLVYAWDYCRQRKGYFFCAVLLFPLMMLFLWKRHVALVFPDGMGAKHSMSFENFGNVFAKKTPEDIRQIAVEILGRFRSIGSVEVGMMLFLTILFGAVIILLVRNRRPVKKILGMLAAVWGCFGIYTCSMFGMYLFSMPLGEARHLASYERYMLSVLIFLYGIAVIYMMDLLTAITPDDVPETDGVPETDSVSEADSMSETDSVPETDAAPETDAVPETDAAPETDSMPETDAVPETDAAPETDSMPETDAVPETDSMPETDAVPETDSMPETDAVPKTDSMPEADSVPETDAAARTASAAGTCSAVRTAGMAVVLLLLCCPLWQVRTKLADLYRKPDFEGTKRCELQQMVQRDHLDKGKAYFIYCNGTDDEARYLFYLSRYEFWSADVIVTNEHHFEENKDQISDCDYLILWDTDAQMDRFLAQNGLGQYQGMERAAIILS